MNLLLISFPQRLQHKASELNSLKAALAASENKEAQLKSNVAALGSRVSTLDRELRYDAAYVASRLGF